MALSGNLGLEHRHWQRGVQRYLGTHVGYIVVGGGADVISWEKIVDPAAGAEVMSLLNEHLAGRSSIYRSEHRLRRKDGSWMWVAGILDA